MGGGENRVVNDTGSIEASHVLVGNWGISQYSQYFSVFDIHSKCRILPMSLVFLLIAEL